MVLLWRSVAARATALAGLVLLVVSMGPQLRVGGEDTSIPLPFGLVSHVPIIDLVSVARFAMVTATVVGVLLALATDQVTRLPHRRRVAFWVGADRRAGAGLPETAAGRRARRRCRRSSPTGCGVPT